MKFHTRFSARRLVGVSTDKPSLVQPQFQASCDIGNMIRRALTGDPSVFRKPRYANVLAAPDSFADAQFRLADARTLWNDLPDKVRATYGTPEALLADFDRVQRMKSESVTPKGGSPSNGEPCADSDLTLTSTGDTKSNPATSTKE